MNLLRVLHFSRWFNLLVWILVGQIHHASGNEVIVSAPLFLPAEDHWQVIVQIPEMTDASVPLVPLAFFVVRGVRTTAPCGQVTDICCLAQQFRVSAWKGDTDVLDTLAEKCELRDDGASGSNLSLADLEFFHGQTWESGEGYRDEIVLTLERSDLTDDNAQYVGAGSYEVSVLVLLVQPWADWSDSHLVSVQTDARTVRLNTQHSIVSPSVAVLNEQRMCTNSKPINSIWVSVSVTSDVNSSRCEWVCETGFSRCPLYASDDTARCVVKPTTTGRVFFTTVGVLSEHGGMFQDEVDFVNRTHQLREMTEQLAAELLAYEFPVHDCLLYVTTDDILRDVTEYSTTGGSLLDNFDSAYRHTFALHLAETFKVASDMSAVRKDPSTNIAYSVLQEERYQVGFIEYHFLLYAVDGSGGETGMRSVQSEKLRRVIHTFFMRGAGNATVLYITDALVMDLETVRAEYISVGEILLVVFWALVVLTLLLWNVCCPSGVALFQASSCTTCANTCANTCTVTGSPHSPRGRLIIALFAGFLFLVFLVLLCSYVLLLLPTVSEVAVDRRAFIALALFGATLLPGIALYVLFCTCLTTCLTRKSVSIQK
jgi:hypothetical protein